MGLIAGVLAKWVMPGPDPGGIVVTALIGVIGAFVGGYLLGFLPFIGSTGSISFGSVLTAFLGAIVVLALYRLITRRVV